MRTTSCLTGVVLACVLGMVATGESDVHLWTFDESEGIVVDDAISSRAGEVYGAMWTNGQKGSGLRFDGLDDYVALPVNDPVWLPTEDFAVSFWVYFERDKGTSANENEVLVDFNAGSSSDPANELGYIVFRHGEHGTIAFQMTTMRNTDEDLESQLIPVKDRWYHIVAVRQGSLQKIYIDGRLDAWRACSSSPIDFIGGYDDNKVNVGRFTTTVGSPRYHFKGMLDELMLFDRALLATEVHQLYQEGITSNVLYVDGTHGSDHNSGFCSLTALATIQTAIERAKDGDVVSVGPGIYREEVRFLGKAITLQSLGDAAVIEAPEGFGVSFYTGEGSGSVLRNFVIANSYVGIFCSHSSPTIANVTVTGNIYGVEGCGSATSTLYERDRAGLPLIRNSIIWGNVESDLEGCNDWYCCVDHIADSVEWSGSHVLGDGSFSDDPLFVDPENGDYHVRSERGRYWPEHDVWVLDDVTSPCVDAGDPVEDVSGEIEPNGNRINIGAHGGTAYAARSDPPFTGDINGDGVFDATDYSLFMELWNAMNPSPPTSGRR